MIRIDIKTDIRHAQRFYTNLRKNAVGKAASRAINDALVTMRAEGAREIKRAHPVLRIGDIKNAMTMHKAFQYSLRGSVDTTGRPQSLLLFGARATRRGVTARIGTGPRRVTMYQGRKAFIVDKFGGEVFVRRFPNGRQIRRFRGPSMPGVFRAQGEKFKAIGQRRWAQAFTSRMQYEIELAKR